MEIPIIYRETKTRITFEGLFKQVTDKATGRVDTFFKYPGGEIPFLNGENFVYRLTEKGFKEEEIEKILVLLMETIATETTVTSREISKSLVEV